ncbi:MAG: AMP-binding protein [Bauldia sp.]|nr:AMP-binding protein [Bauldia sp.]
MLARKAAEGPDRLAVVGGETRWTYADLDAEADRLARGFLASGLVPGERVIVHMPNLASFVAVVFGLFRAGLVPVFALPAHRSAEIGHFAAKAEASAYVIADRHEGFDYRTIAESVTAALPSLRRVFVEGEPGRFAALAELRGKGDGTPLPAGGSASDVALVQLSGGSTGFSKLIPRTHDDYLYSVRQSVEVCGLGPDCVYLVALPAAHNFPMSSPGILGALYAGGTVVLSRSPSPDEALPLIERERATMVALVPPLALVWAEAAARTRHDLSSLRTVQVGGAKLTMEAARRIGPALGARLQQVFGMAEGLVNYTRPGDPEEIVLGTQGRPMSPADEVLVVDDIGVPVADGTPGHLLTRGPYTIRAYHNEPEANRRAFTEDGFYRTGDIVTRRPDGYLVVAGRATDVINRGGEKIAPDEVEDHLRAHPAIHDAVIVGMPDAYLGEKSCAFVVTRETLRAADVKAWVRTRGLAGYKVPDSVVFLAALPATAVGKTSRRELRKALAASLPAPAQSERA